MIGIYWNKKEVHILETYDEFYFFMKEIERHLGLKLINYKREQLERRLNYLRQKRGYDTFHSFLEAILKNKEIREEFLDRVTINVSDFFRNSQYWDTLNEYIIPQFLSKNNFLKCWSAACSSGEEAYSLSMLLNENKFIKDYSILATDLDENILNIARSGKYTVSDLKECPIKYIPRYFKEMEKNIFELHPNIKKPIFFKKHDLLVDSFDSNYDLIICRNVVIYFNEDAKIKLYQKFSSALKKGGILFVGATEQIFNAGDYGLELVKPFFYRKK